MNYDIAGLAAISTQLITLTSWKQLYSDTSNTILSGDQSSSLPLFYLDVIGLVGTGKVAGVSQYTADLIIDVAMPIGPAVTGLHAETLTDEDKNLIGAILQPPTVAKLLIDFFDVPVFVPPAVAIGDIFTLVSLRFLRQEQPRLLRGANRELVRYHIEWKFAGIGF